MISTLSLCLILKNWFDPIILLELCHGYNLYTILRAIFVEICHVLKHYWHYSFDITSNNVIEISNTKVFHGGFFLKGKVEKEDIGHNKITPNLGHTEMENMNSSIVHFEIGVVECNMIVSMRENHMD